MSAVVSHTIERSVGEAADAAARLIERCVQHAVAELQASETKAEAERRKEVSEAWRAMLTRREDWGQRFPGLLQAAIEADVCGDGPAPTETGNSGFAALTLVDDSEISRKIESTRLAQQLTAMLERPLAELDPLMSSALGLDGIQPQRNPLRPGIYAQVLRKLVEDDQSEPGWTALWLRSMVKPLAQGLDELYRGQAKLLTDAQVHAADYKVLTTPGKAPAAAAPKPAPLAASAPAVGPAGTAAVGTAPAPVAAAAPAAAAPAAVLPRLDAARLQQFLARDEAQAHEALGADFLAQAEAELRALEERVDARSFDAQAAQQHRDLPVVDRPARSVGTDSPLPTERWGEYAAPRERSLVRGRLKTQARELGQVIGLEAVRQVIDKVAEDPRLLAPVREAMVALEPSLARLAMVSPRFLSDDAHPGRQLVERVAQRSFKYNDEFSPEFQDFVGTVAETVGRLNQLEKFRNATPFQAALAALQTEWAEVDAEEQDKQRKALERVQFAERRQKEAEQLAGQWKQREDLRAAPQPVQDFVLRTWSLVMAHAKLTHDSQEDDPGGHRAVVTDLLWSVNRDATLHEPARAFALIPRLLQKLRDGLASLGQAPSDSDAFFHELENLHRPVLKLRARHRHGTVAPPEPPPPTSVAPQRPAEQPWMPEAELRAAGFDDTHPSDFHDLPPEQRPTQGAAQSLGDRAAEEVLGRLEPGTWVDLFAHSQWRRAKLAWAADKGTLFMFLSQGGQPHSMTRRSLHKLVKHQLLRPVLGDGVVPRALQGLAQPSPLTA
ncbi:MAG TPA: DUF1631 family protein [Ramlibacter sp.]|uniref:DUF1631 family protein n=1 Tax=Ramlibacter sp. TaxID=1917967 RepID=UPI002ED0C977